MFVHSSMMHLIKQIQYFQRNALKLFFFVLLLSANCWECCVFLTNYSRSILNFSISLSLSVTFCIFYSIIDPFPFLIVLLSFYFSLILLRLLFLIYLCYFAIIFLLWVVLLSISFYPFKVSLFISFLPPSTDYSIIFIIFLLFMRFYFSISLIYFKVMNIS